MEKKKTADYIIPSTFFTVSPTIQKKEAPKKETTETIPTPVPEKAKDGDRQLPVLEKVRKRNFSLSLRSVHAQKEEEKTREEKEENFQNSPREPFTQKDLLRAWKEYHSTLLQQGEKNIASIMVADTPKQVRPLEVQLTLPSKLMAEQLEGIKSKLQKHLRTTLNNYGVQIEILVKETATKNFVYTPEEKYKKLLEINPLLKKLKDTFHLDL